QSATTGCSDAIRSYSHGKSKTTESYGRPVQRGRTLAGARGSHRERERAWSSRFSRPGAAARLAPECAVDAWKFEVSRSRGVLPANGEWVVCGWARAVCDCGGLGAARNVSGDVRRACVALFQG